MFLNDTNILPPFRDGPQSLKNDANPPAIAQNSIHQPRFECGQTPEREENIYSLLIAS